MSSLAAAARGISFAVTAHDLATRTLLRANAAIGLLGRTSTDAGVAMTRAFAGAVGGMMAMGAGVAGFRGLMDITKSAAKFEYAMERVGIVTQATGAEFDALRESALKLGLETEFNAVEVADAMHILGQAGFTSKEIANDLASAVLDLTTASGEMINTAQAAGAMSTAVKVFQKDIGSDYRMAADMMVRATQVTRLEFKDLERGFAGISGEARLFGQSFQETLALLSATRDVGFTAAGGANAIRIAMKNLVGNAPHFAKITGQSIYDASGNMKSFMEIMDVLSKHWAATGADMEQRNKDIFKIFNKWGFRGAGIVMKAVFTERDTGRILTGVDAIREMGREIANSAGASKEAATRMRQTLLGTLERIKNSFISMKIIVGKFIVPMIATLADKFFDLTVKVNNFLATHPGFVKVGAAVTALASAFLMLAGAIATAAFSYTLMEKMMAGSSIETLIKGFMARPVKSAATAAAAGMPVHPSLITPHTSADALTALRYRHEARERRRTGILGYEPGMHGIGRKSVYAEDLPVRRLGETYGPNKGSNFPMISPKGWKASAVNLALFTKNLGLFGAMLAVAGSGIYLFAKGESLMKKGAAEGRIELELLGKVLRKVGLVIFPVLQGYVWARRIFHGVAAALKFLWKTTEGSRLAMRGMFAGFRKGIYPVMRMLELLKLLREQGFKIQGKYLEELYRMGMLKPFTTLGTLMKRFENFDEALAEVKKNMGKLFLAPNTYFGTPLKKIGQSLGEIVTNTVSYALGGMTSEEYEKEIKRIKKSIRNAYIEGFGKLFTRLSRMSSEDWAKALTPLVQAFWMLVKILVPIMWRLFKGLFSILWNMFSAMFAGVFSGLFISLRDFGTQLANTIYSIFMRAVQMFITNAAARFMPFGGLFRAGGAVNTAVGGFQSLTAPPPHTPTPVVSGGPGGQQKIEIIVDGKVLASVINDGKNLYQITHGLSAVHRARSGSGGP